MHSALRSEYHWAFPSVHWHTTSTSSSASATSVARSFNSAQGGTLHRHFSFDAMRRSSCRRARPSACFHRSRLCHCSSSKTSRGLHKTAVAESLVCLRTLGLISWTGQHFGWAFCLCTSCYRAKLRLESSWFWTSLWGKASGSIEHMRLSFQSSTPSRLLRCCKILSAPVWSFVLDSRCLWCQWSGQCVGLDS